MTGLLRAERIRLGRRKALQAIVLAIPLLAATFFLLGFRSTDLQPFFDEAAERQQLTAQFSQPGVSPEEVKLQVDQIIESERQSYEQMRSEMERMRATYVFPASIVTLLGSATLAFFFGTVLLTATTIGDEFGWGTIRTTLLASSNRRRWLAVRLGVLVALVGLWFGALLLLSLGLPLVIAAVVGPLPASAPVDPGAILVVAGGHLLGALMLVGFAAAASLVMRSGSIALVVALVYALVETVVLGLLAQLGPFRPVDSFGQGNPAGPFAWVLNLFPMHAIQMALGIGSQLATNQGGGSSFVLSDAYVPLAVVAGWAAIFLAVAAARFTRMDIAE